MIIFRKIMNLKLFFKRLGLEGKACFQSKMQKKFKSLRRRNFVKLNLLTREDFVYFVRRNFVSNDLTSFSLCAQFN